MGGCVSRDAKTGRVEFNCLKKKASQPEDSKTATNVVEAKAVDTEKECVGQLHMKGEDAVLGVHTWHSFRFHLREIAMFYSNASTGNSVGAIPVEAIEDLEFHVDSTKKCSNVRFNILLVGGRIIELKAASTAEKKRWSLCLRATKKRVSRTGVIEKYKDQEYWHGALANEVLEEIRRARNTSSSAHVSSVISLRDQSETSKRKILSQKIVQLSSEANSNPDLTISKPVVTCPESATKTDSKPTTPEEKSHRPRLSFKQSRNSPQNRKTTKSPKHVPRDSETSVKLDALIYQNSNIDRGLSDDLANPGKSPSNFSVLATPSPPASSEKRAPSKAQRRKESAVFDDVFATV
eukprot:CAMPEP_0167813152 /NCGR_PEP_ID=MMETSP0112_2-20121227/1680_1 /TAXON_ID=91324 /ORGANISM="Lotharella globosa, Strain CCCM811" /LENGTH=349 /DNA_ID=CAMNT_0007712173 /DNA_START=107 /DNA_END=1156 /DNA_ORIENTATION=+